jgi:hypothetical protein
MMKVELRSYLSSHHLWAASHFSRLASDIEATWTAGPKFHFQHRGYVIAAVLESVAFLEAMINELLQDAADGHEGYVGHLDAAIRVALASLWSESRDGTLSTLAKYQLALVAAGQTPLERGANPYQAVQLVIKLRNALVHFRPESASGDTPQAIAAQLKGKFAPNRLLAGATGNPYFPDHCLGAGCAHWAAGAVRALADEACGRLGVSPNYQRIAWDPKP